VRKHVAFCLSETIVEPVNLFVTDGIIVVTKGLHRTEEIARAKAEDALPRQFPMIVLVNEHSASAAEIKAGRGQ